jgi:lysophospholipase L1-like esterase
MRLLKFTVFLLLFAISASAQKIVDNADTRIRYQGRIGHQDGVAQLYWSGTSMEVNFTGSTVKALLKDERGENYFNIIIDGKITVLHPDTAKRLYTLASGLKAGNHTLLLYKRTEFSDGSTAFYNFQFEPKAEVLPASPQKNRTIEFYGNSITAGYAVEDFSGSDSYLSRYKNNYISYGALVARHFNAQYSFIVKSGIGVMVGYYPETMGQIFDRLNPTDANSKWDFSKYTPEVIVINLFQNDASLTRSPTRPEYLAKFPSGPPTEAYIIQSYKKLVQGIRAKNPNAQIICVLGNMDASKEGLPWPGYIQSAVDELKDKKVFVHIFPYKNTPGHPSIKEQQTMADDLTKFIDAYIKW